MAIETYSLKRSGKDFKLSDHFTLGEMACGDGSDMVLVSRKLIEILEEIRAWARRTQDPEAIVIITSGYRTASYNASPSVGGSKGSKHILGEAADIKIIYRVDGEKRFVEPRTIERALDKGEVTGAPFFGGLGRYRSWLHVDVRTDKNARWKGK